MRALSSAIDQDQCRLLHAAGATVYQIGESAKGECLVAYSMGSPQLPSVSIVAGAHPDEPAGPLAALALCQRYAQSKILQRVRLVVIPQLDIDGVIEQAAWLAPYEDTLDPLLYLRHRLRRLPGEDREFAWPGAAWGGTVLPECAAADVFLRCQGPFIAHLSLHGMAIAEGAWFLLDEAGLRDAQLWRDLRHVAATHHFALHDSPRYGEKGFRRAGRGFCSIPNGAAMRRWAMQSKQLFAQHFAFSSMDAVNAYSSGPQKPLCAVSEFPLISVDKPGDGEWRSALPGILLADSPESAWLDVQHQYGLGLVPLQRQVSGMLGMCEAVIAAALAKHEFS